MRRREDLERHGGDGCKSDEHDDGGWAGGMILSERHAVEIRRFFLECAYNAMTILQKIICYRTI
jgi:hypothetical protein